MVLLINGCGGAGGSSSSFTESSTNPAFLSKDKITIEIDKVATFIFKVVARDASNVKYYITGGDANRFSIDVITGELTFLKLDGIEAKSVYKFVAIAEDSVGHREMQNITVSIAEKESVKEESDILTPTPTSTPMPINQAPLANAGADSSTTVNQAITLRGTASDSDGKVIGYEWQIGNRVLATTANFEYLPTVIGIYSLTLTVTDDDGATDSDGVLVTVQEVAIDISSKWVTPSKNICESNGGVYNKHDDNQCQANWENAKKVCRAIGKELPTIETFRKVMTDCGGISTDWDNNKNNSFYQACYKEKGFTSNVYWSSTTNTLGSPNVWGVYFYFGDDSLYRKTDEYRVQCVQGVNSDLIFMKGYVWRDSFILTPKKD
jgi:hypothetical protein